jgi:hypothetical protein
MPRRIRCRKTHLKRLGSNTFEQKGHDTIMKLNLATATLGAALFLAGAPALAMAADVQSGPIHIDNVSVYGRDVLNENGGDTGVPGTATIVFTNQYGSPATEVVFVLETNGYVLERFSETGSFAPGVKINHSFAENESSTDLRVAVERATFADGTVWDNPDVPPAPEPNPTIGVAPDQF